MLDQNAEEALDRSVQCAMHHHRLLARSVFSYVLQAKALRQVEVKLHGRKLPKPADRIHQLDVNLRPVKAASPGMVLYLIFRRLSTVSSERVARFHCSSLPKKFFRSTGFHIESTGWNLSNSTF